jgi:phage gpG-like protein
MQIYFEIEGVVQMHRRFTKFAKDIKDWSLSTEKIGKYLKTFFSNDVFQSEGAVFGEKWVGGKYYHKLQRTGLMRNNFYFKNNKNQVEIGNTTDYFKYHQSNKPRKSKLPRRIMMKLDEERKKTITRFFAMQINAYKRANKL